MARGLLCLPERAGEPGQIRKRTRCLTDEASGALILGRVYVGHAPTVVNVDVVVRHPPMVARANRPVTIGLQPDRDSPVNRAHTAERVRRMRNHTDVNVVRPEAKGANTHVLRARCLRRDQFPVLFL